MLRQDGWEAFWYLLLLCNCFIHAQQNGEILVKKNIKLDKIGQLENKILSLEKKLDQLTLLTRKDAEPAMFFATRDSSAVLTLQKKSIVVFPYYQINIGNNYNRYDGVFTAPVDGTYLFSWTVSTDKNGYVVTELVVNSRTITSTGDTGTSPSVRSASATALCKMRQDEHAFIRTTSFGTDHSIFSSNQNPMSSFLGMLVHPD